MNLRGSIYDIFGPEVDYTLGTQDDYAPEAIRATPVNFDEIGVINTPTQATQFPDILGSIAGIIKSGFETSMAIDRMESAANLEQQRAQAQTELYKAQTQAQISALQQPRIVAAGGINPMYLLAGAAGLVGLLVIMKRR